MNSLHNFSLTKLTPKTYMSFLLLLLAGVGIFQQGINSVYLQLILAIGVSIALDTLITLIKTKRLILPSSAFITGMIIAMVLSPNVNWRIPVVAAFIAILQKHIIRYPASKPVFNPAAIGLLAVIVLFHAHVSWWGQSVWWLVIAFGLFISYKTKKLIIPIVFILANAIIFTLAFYLKDKVWLNPFLYVNFFFVFIMLIEPKTSPYASKSQYVYGILAAIFSFLFFLFLPRYDYSILALVTTNFLMSLAFL